MKLQGFENNETNQLEKLGVLRVNITGGMQTTLIHFIFVMERGLLFGILKNHTPVASHSDDRKKNHYRLQTRLSPEMLNYFDPKK